MRYKNNYIIFIFHKKIINVIFLNIGPTLKSLGSKDIDIVILISGANVQGQILNLKKVYTYIFVYHVRQVEKRT